MKVIVILLLASLVLIPSSLEAFAQVVETKGENYDLTEDFEIGEAKWQSHPDRILDGVWKNYVLTDTKDKVIFNTNSVGSLVYDKNSCSYSIYENGYDGVNIIPSVSAVASYQDSMGVWSNLPVNDQACAVTVVQYDDGIFLTSTKGSIGLEEFFIPTDYNSTSIENNMGYVNGLGIVNINEFAGVGVDGEKFVQELDLNIHKGFKETFKVWHTGEEELGISQTVHTEPTLVIGDQTIDIEALNGQSFDKQYIEDNEAEILQLTDSINYEFTTGILSLSNVNIIFDETSTIPYKVNLDYANGLDGVPFVGYLEIDPTLTVTQNDWARNRGTATSGASCSTTAMASENNAQQIYLPPSGTSDNCRYVIYEYDIATIPDNSVVTQLQMGYDISATGNSNNFSIYDISPTTPTAIDDGGQSLWNESTSGTAYVDDDTGSASTGTSKTVNFNTDAITSFETALTGGDSVFRYSITLDDGVRNSVARHATFANTSLEVTYTIPTIPQPPTSLTATTGIPIVTSWTAPTDNGNSALTGYKVSRSLEAFAGVELPNSSGSDSQITFTDNELLVHGFPVSDSSTNAITITSTGTTTSGNIGTAIQNPSFSFTDTNLPDNTDILSVGGWVSIGADSDDFTSYASDGVAEASYPTSDNTVIKVNTSTDKVEYTFSRDASTYTAEYLSHDLTGATLADDWTLRIHDLTATTKSGVIHSWIGISNSATAESSTSQNFAGVEWGGSTSDVLDFSAESGYSAALARTASSSTLNVGTAYFVEVIKEGSIVTVNVFSDSGFSSLVASEKHLFYVNPTDLRFFKVTSDINASATVGTAVVTFSKIEFVENSSSFTSTKLLGLGTISFNIDQTTANVIKTTETTTATANQWGSPSPLRTGANGSPITATQTGSSCTNLANGAIQATDGSNYVTGNGNAWQGVRTYNGYSSTSCTVIFDYGGLTPITTVETYYGGYGNHGGSNQKIIGYYSTDDQATWTQFTSQTGSSGYSGANTVVGSTSVNINTSITHMKYYMEANDGWKTLVETRQYLTEYDNTSADTNIISVTGLTDNTSTPQHYATTRDSSNLWTIYQNGASVATATDSTTLGTNVGNNYSTNLTGSLDEFFINSDTLTSTEIDDIYDRGVAPSLIDSPTLTTSSDSSVSGGTTYYYTVQAVNAIGSSTYTPFVSGLAGTPPDPPTSISATIANTATAPLDITVSWSAPTTVGSGTLTGFEIFRDGVSQGTVGLVTTFPDTVPSSGTYAYTVKAISTHGTSVASSADSITTPSAPSQPTLTVTVLDDTSMKLDWTASNENSSTLQGYWIEYSLDNSVWANLVSNTGNTAVTRTATSLNVDDQYYWRVSGINGVGAGTASATQNDWTLLSAPTNLVATSMAVDQIDLAWTGISGISSYTIQYESPTGNGFTNLATGVSSSDTTYTSGSLTTGTQYNYRIFGVSTNSGSNSVASNEDSANTFGILPAPVLDLLTSVTVNPATVQLDWTASSGNPVATGYKIERNLGSGFIVLESDTASVSTTYTDSATTSMNEPSYRISAINSYGTSPASNELTLTVVSSGGSGGGSSGGGGGSSKKIVTAIDELLNISILGNTHVMTNGEFLTGKIPISWDSGENLRISAVDYDDSILDSIQFNIEDTAPIILKGSGNSFSSDDITYTISTPTQICNALTSDPSKKITTNCLQEKLYELPITVTATSVGDNISQTTLITIDTRSGFGGDTLALLSIFIMVIIAGIGIIKLARKSSGGKRNHSTNGQKKAPKTPKKPRKSIK